MGSDLTARKSPEERALDQKRRELDDLTNILGERELELATLKSELAAFEFEYLTRVGQRYAELDEIEAAIAQCLAENAPDDDELFQKAREAQSKAEESAEAVGGADAPRRAAVGPKSDELRELYREAAKAVHPDRATSEEERLKREEMMAKVNEAFQQGDSDRIREILDEWEHSPEAVHGVGPGADLVRVIRQIERVSTRIMRIETEIAELSRTAMSELKSKYDAAAAEGRDLFFEMVGQICQRIDDARTRLESLKGRS